MPGSGHDIKKRFYPAIDPFYGRHIVRRASARQRVLRLRISHYSLYQRYPCPYRTLPTDCKELCGPGRNQPGAALVKKIRYNSDHTLLLDAGDVFYGTPWFDVFRGSVDFRVMSSMGYDAMTPGEHEFKYGADLFLEAAKEAGFPFLAANYRAQNADLNSLIEDQIIREYSGFNVGVFGIGIDLNSQIENGLEKEINTLDPVRIARRAVNSLRLHHHCDYVICLSHLGLSQESGGIDDLRLAESVSGIDLIIG